MKNKVKKLFCKILRRASDVKCNCKLKMLQAKEKLQESKCYLVNSSGEGSIDFVIKVIIAVVLGGLILAALILLFNGTIFPTFKQKVIDMFNW